jgi:hypothetical protein
VKLKEDVNNIREELMKFRFEITKMFAHNDRLSVLDQAIRKDVSIFQEKSGLPDTRLSDLIYLSDNRNIEKFKIESNSILDIYENENIDIDNNNPSLAEDDNNSPSTSCAFNSYFYNKN